MAVNKVIFGGETVVDLTTDTVTAVKMLSGTTAHDKSGNKVTGTIPTKTASNMTVSGATVTAPAGYYASAQSKSVATATQATPSISVDSAGKITASATQTAGYVSAGTKSATKQLTTQAAKTITPSTSSQTAVASGVYTTGAVTVAAIPSAYVKPTATKAATTYTPTTSNQTIAAGTYCSGAQTIKGDANLVPENIASGVSIFGIEGRLAVGEAGNTPSISVVNNTDMMLICGTTPLEPGATGQVFDGGCIPVGFLPLNSVDMSAAGKTIYFSKNGITGQYYTTLDVGGKINGMYGYPAGVLMLMCSDGSAVAIGDTIELTEG